VGCFISDAYQAAAGANVLFNLSAAMKFWGRTTEADYRFIRVRPLPGSLLLRLQQYRRVSNDIVFGGHTLIAENGTILDEAPSSAVKRN
jgi:hypothetical protein